MAKAKVVKYETLIKLFRAIGVKTADEWGDEKLIKNTKDLKHLAEGVDVKSEKAQALLEVVVGAPILKIKKGDDLLLVRGEEVKEKTKKKEKAKKETPKMKKKTKKKEAVKKTTKKKAASSEKKTTRRKTILGTVLESLQKKSPLTKDALIKILEKTFPERRLESMISTLLASPGYYRVHKIAVVERDDEGRFVLKKMLKKG